MTPGPPSIATLEAEARHARDRARLYRARSYGPRPANPARLRELERIQQGAEARLERARRAAAAAEARRPVTDDDPTSGERPRR